MAVAVLLPDPLIVVFATGPPTTQPVDPVATTRPGAAGDTAESTPTQGKTTESKVTPSTKSDRPKVRDRIGAELHQVTDLPGPVVHRRFHRAVDEGHPRRCGRQGDYRRPDDDQRPISQGTPIEGSIRGCGLITIVMRMCHQSGPPLDGDWFR